MTTHQMFLLQIIFLYLHALFFWYIWMTYLTTLIHYVVQIEGNDKYADSGPPYLIFLHPALGPLWEVTRQKVISQSSYCIFFSFLFLEIILLYYTVHCIDVPGNCNQFVGNI